MFPCLFCQERSRVSYWSNWCEECANLRRMLLIYSPDKCTEILKRTLTRDETQISFKIQQEVKKIVLKQIEAPTEVDAEVDESQHEYEGRKTRSKKKHSSSI